jgi:hypothetical protein
LNQKDIDGNIVGERDREREREREMETMGE